MDNSQYAEMLADHAAAEVAAYRERLRDAVEDMAQHKLGVEGCLIDRADVLELIDGELK